MKTNTTTYKAIFESDAIKTNDARKVLRVQTVVGSNGTITTNLLVDFKSDKTEGKGYVKALAFNLPDESMKSLLEAFASSQKALTAETKKNKTLSAKPQATTLSGNAQVDALRKAGLTDEQISALGIELPKAPKEPITTPNDDIFSQVMAMLTPAQLKKIQNKGGAKNEK